MSFFRPREDRPASVEDWEYYLPPESSLRKHWGDEASQIIYAKRCASVVNGVLEKFSEASDAQSIYFQLADGRREIATELKQNPNIGVKRVPPKPYQTAFHTPMWQGRGQYQDFTPLLKMKYDLLYQKLTNQMTTEQLEALEQGDKVKVTTEDGTFVVAKFAFTTSLDFIDTGRELTHIAQYVTPMNYSTTEYYLENDMDVSHTAVEHSEAIFKENIQPLYDALLRDRTPNEENIDRIATMVWYLAHACPLARGSAATTEMFCRTMMKLAGFPMVKFEGNMSMDLEALFTPKAQFVDNFKNFLFPELLARPSYSPTRP